MVDEFFVEKRLNCAIKSDDRWEKSESFVTNWASLLLKLL